jgi:hypothetical protein
MRHIGRFATVALVGLAGPALARQNPTPPPSGIVVHLFGPNSIASNILPTMPMPGPAASPAPATMPSGPGAAANPAIAQSAAPAAADAGYQAPSLHDVLHQMFVTGDPDQKQGQDLAPGRTAERY